MHAKMMKLLQSKKKEGNGLSESEKKAKMEALKGMKSMASEMMGEKLKGLKKEVPLNQSEENEDPSAERDEMPDEMKSEEDYNWDKISAVKSMSNHEEIDNMIEMLQKKKEELSNQS